MQKIAFRNGAEEFDAGVATANNIWHNCARDGFIWPEDLGTSQFAAGALEEFGRLQERDMHGLAGRIARGAQKGAEQLNTNPWHGLVEVVQNADDVAANEIIFLLDEEKRLLHMRHNGESVQVRHVLALTYAFVSTKGDDPRATGRFGVGLKTLGQLGKTLDVHSGAWAFSIHDGRTTPIGAHLAPKDFFEPETGNTLFTLHLKMEVDLAGMGKFCGNLGNAITLFLKSVTNVEFRTGSESWTLGYKPIEQAVYSQNIIMRRFEDSDGEKLLRFDRILTVPEGASRTDKATGTETVIGVAFAERGSIYLTLPTLIKTGFTFALNADFDPVSSRESLRESRWNEWLLEELAQVVADVLVRMFQVEPEYAWYYVPLHDEVESSNEWLREQLRNLQSEVFRRLQAEAGIMVSGTLVPFASLSFAEEEIEGLLEDRDPELIFPATSVVPLSARGDGWRVVLPPLGGKQAGLEEAFTLFDIPDTADRTAEWHMALCEKALEVGKGPLLTIHSCFKLDSGRTNLLPKAGATAWVTHGLWGDPLRRLVLVKRLSPEYQSLQKWPEFQKTLEAQFNYRHVISDSDQLEALAKRPTPVRLTPGELVAVKRMVELTGKAWPHLGRVIEIDAYHYKKGKKIPGARAISDCYLPGAIAKEKAGTWAKICEEVEGLWWASPALATTLKGVRGRYSEGLGERGPRAFLQKLGAEIAPRLVSRTSGPARTHNFCKEQEKAVPVSFAKLVNDHECPDLEIVLAAIEKSRKKLRPELAQQLFGVLSLSWDRLYAPYVVAKAEWEEKRKTNSVSVTSTWLCRLKERPWLYSASKKPVSPVGLAIPTPVNRAIYGNNPDRLALGLTERDAIGTLPKALGMLVAPDATEILKQLEQLKGRSESEWPLTGPVLMRALAERCGPSRAVVARVDGLSVAELQAACNDRRLVYLSRQNRFVAPREILYGTDIFHGYRLFVPRGSKLDPLWRVLKIREPEAADCVDVIEQIGNCEATDGAHGAVHEALLLLAKSWGREDLRDRMARLPIWNGRRFIKIRPAFVTTSPEVAAALDDEVTIWRPKFDPFSHPQLLHNLKIRPIGCESITVIPGCQQADDDLYARYHSAVTIMKARLAAETPACYRTVDWEAISGATLNVGSGLTLRITLQAGREKIIKKESAARCYLETGSGTTFYLADSDALGELKEGGRLIASFFHPEHRLQAATLWFYAWAEAGSGRIIEAGIDLARDTENEDEDDSLEKLAEKTVGKRKTVKRGDGAQGGKGGSPAGDEKKAEAAQPPPPLELKKPQWLMTTSVEIEHADKTNGGQKNGKGRGLKEKLPDPDRKNNGGGGGGRVRNYTSVELEDAGYLALEHLFNHAGESELLDFRKQRGIGADAVLDRSSLMTWFEMKSFSGEPPAQVTLTGSEFERARKAGPNFCLAVVSGLAVGYDTVVRVYVNPLATLDWSACGAVAFSGIGSRKSLTCCLHGE